VIGVSQSADVALANKAIETADRAFQSWQYVSAKDRADRLFKVAEIIRRRKFELSAWLIKEVGKSWPEADGEVCEAVDFCEFYAREALRYAKVQQCLNMPGENDTLRYIPLGVGVVIPPWNFPFAILAGMTTAAWVTGNTVVLKPSSDSPIIAQKFMEIVEEAGLPDGVVNLVTGGGGSIGDALVAHPRTRFVSFTGSKAVGLHINELAAKMQPGQKWIKRVVAEMGGKDSIVVDSDANLEKAAKGIVSSAFGFQGQKCSACSRAIIVKDVYDKVVDLVVERTKQIKVGPTEDKDNFMGPVVNKKAFDSIRNYIEIGKKEGRLVAGGDSPKGNGYFINPTVIVDVKPGAKIDQEEIFGPVLAVIKAKDFDDALAIANATEYGLTGAVYSKNKEHQAKAVERFHVGNLYINRKCTGAMVACHPFGGFNMSGTCSKAGGKDYLLLFMQSKAVGELTGAIDKGRP
jgi:1-pyrroline-5-carboxylate dehydrogenase